MTPPDRTLRSEDTLARVRIFILVLLVLGLAGTAAELFAIDHSEDSWQLVPLFAITFAFIAIVWHRLDRGVLPLRFFQGVMFLLILVGLIGIVLHYQGNVEFQLEMDPSQHGWALLRKVLHATAPPAMAPAVMTQLGLLGLVYSYRFRS